MSERHVDLLDWIRTFAVMVIVVGHAAVAFMVHAPASWYIHDARRWIACDAEVVLAQIVLMPMLFFVTGCVVPHSLARRKTGSFLGARALRLLVPFTVALPIIQPFDEWLRDPSRSFPKVWIEFWGLAINHGHLWFLPYIFLLAAAAALARNLRPSAFEAAKQTQTGFPSATIWVLVTLALALGKTCMLGFWADDDWIATTLLNIQPSRVPIHVGFFLLGLAAGFGRWHETPPSPRRLGVSAVGLVLSSAGFLAVKASGLPLRPLDGLTNAGATVCMLLLVYEVLRRCRPPASRMVKSLIACSYPIHLVHYAAVMGFGYLVREVDLHAAVKYPFVAAATLGTSWILAMGLRRLPGAHRILG